MCLHPPLPPLYYPRSAIIAVTAAKWRRAAKASVLAAWRGFARESAFHYESVYRCVSIFR